MLQYRASLGVWLAQLFGYLLCNGDVGISSTEHKFLHNWILPSEGIHTDEHNFNWIYTFKEIVKCFCIFFHFFLWLQAITIRKGYTKESNSEAVFSDGMNDAVMLGSIMKNLTKLSQKVIFAQKKCWGRASTATGRKLTQKIFTTSSHPKNRCN